VEDLEDILVALEPVMADTIYPVQKPWLFDLRSSKQLIGLAVFATTFTDGFLYGIVSSCFAEALEAVNRIG
jgi:hypothetical protein